MKKIIKSLLFIFFVFSISNGFCQYRIKEIKAIDNLCHKLDIKKWNQVKKYSLIEGDSGTKLYYAENSLQKLTHTNYGEIGKQIIIFYLINKQIVKVTETEYQYHGNYADTTLNKNKTTKETSKSYFQKGKMFHQIGEDCGSPFTKDFLDSETIRLQERYKEILRLVK
jgi:hypothetical protein